MSSQREAAIQIVQKHELLAAGVGLIPIPVIDVVGITALQVRMLNQLSEHYKVTFSDNGSATAAIASLLGGVVPTGLGRSGFRSLIKAIPVVGPLAAWFVMPAFAAAATYAIGMYFIGLFESGGTPEDVDAEALKKEVQREVESREEAPADTKGEAADHGGEAADEGGEAADEGGEPKDMTEIEGIGPAIAKLLREAGIDSYEALAATSAEDLEAILDKPRFRMHKASAGSWQEQATLAAAGKWDELEALQGELRGGR